MINDDDAKQLHDRATRGIELSAAEQAALDAWYARQDAAESARLAVTQPSQSFEKLRAEIGEAVSRLRVVAEQIEAQAAENERVRRENAALQRELLETRAAPRA
jgi:hypothetical protein